MRTIAFTITKICDLIYISILLFFSALIISVTLNKICILFFPKTNEKKINVYFVSEIIFRITYIIVMCYVFRNLVELFPSPFDGYHGFQHAKVKEISSGTLLTTLAFFFQNNLRNDASLLGNDYLGYKSF